jgi:PAS domain S-box-containing protein
MDAIAVGSTRPSRQDHLKMSDDRASILARGTAGAAGIALRALAAFAAIVGAGALGFALPLWGARVPLPHLAIGIAVATLVRWGRGMWPVVLAAIVTVDVLHGSTPVHMVAAAAGLTLGPLLAAWILERRRFDPGFGHYRDVPLFLVAVMLGMLVQVLIGALSYAVEPDPRQPMGALLLLRLWSNAFAGALVIAPLLVAVRRSSFDQALRRRAEFVLYAAVIVAFCIGALVLPPPGMPGQIVRPPLFVLALAISVVAVIRLGFVATAAGGLLMSIAVACSFAFGRGALHDLPFVAGLVTFWSFVGAVTGLVLIVTALLAERDAAAAERLRAERRYAEVFEASPQPLWVYDPATLGVLLVNQATERQYGYRRETLLGMRVTDLAAPGEERAVPGPDAMAHADGEPFETRHVSRDGRVLEVEMWTRPIDFGGQSAVLVFAADVTERKALGRALIDAIAGEQRRIGQEMHDGLGQELTGLSLSMRALATRAGRERLPLAADLDQLATLVTTCIQSARRIVHGLSPLAGADGNLIAALTGLAESGSTSGIQVRVNTRLEAPLTLPLEARNHLFRIAQEALQNAQKHAGARHIDIEFAVRADSVRLAVLDDGKGPPDPSVPAAGLGMRTMRYRAASIRGRLSVRPRSPAGTAVLCEAPQSPPHATALSA